MHVRMSYVLIKEPTYLLLVKKISALDVEHWRRAVVAYSGGALGCLSALFIGSIARITTTRQSSSPTVIHTAATIVWRR